MTLEIRGLSRHYGGGEAALAGINLDIGGGELLALLGPSGAGKTTLLRLIAGLDRPDAGTILIDGVDLRALPGRDRRIGCVFQNYALFRHMNVARNIAFGLSVKVRRERPSRVRIASRVEELLGLMQLSGLGSRFPSQLSGGQRQRVALARALAVDPRVLLLDEPFGALDAKVRGELREWLHGLQRQLGLTTIFVTHDQHEAFQLADRIAVLNAGRVEQVGTPTEIRQNAATPFVREFLDASDYPSRAVPSSDLERKSDAMAFVKPRSHPDPTAEPSDLFLEARDRQACSAVSQRPGMASSAQAGAGPIGRRPPWARRVIGVPPNNSLLDDPPTVAAGELWLIAVPDAESKLTSLEYRALTTANVIVYDRTLTEAVAPLLPLGGYAEPAGGDGLVRCLQFVRDGWSVVRLIEQPSPDDRDQAFQALAQQVRATGVFADWRVRRLSQQDGRWLSGDDNVAPLPIRGGRGAREVIVIGASGATASDLYAVASNGLAG
ncbi:MAG TPA: ATP-binding cassette domain-containing protein [Stellaceae bacterium]|nr:ATP-binding cassette domain-containing protein [Stellaceae bacterium]